MSAQWVPDTEFYRYGHELINKLMRSAIAGLTDDDIVAYRAAICTALPTCEPETIRQLGPVACLLDDELWRRHPPARQQ